MPDPSPYVPGYRHDVFVSYAQVDNKTLGGADGWVYTLVDNLKELLSVQLGRDEWGDIWLDRRIGAGDAIPQEVQRALDGSALLVAILSEGYLASPWCTQERELFLSRLQPPGRAQAWTSIASSRPCTGRPPPHERATRQPLPGPAPLHQRGGGPLLRPRSAGRGAAGQA